MRKLLLQSLSWLTGASRAVLEFLLPILADSASRLLADLLPIALEVVESLDDEKGTGREKRDWAVAQVRTAARRGGIAAGASAINLAVEMAVARLRAEGGK